LFWLSQDNFKDEDSYEFDDSYQTNMEGAFMDEFFQKVEVFWFVDSKYSSNVLNENIINQRLVFLIYFLSFTSKVADIGHKIERITEDVESVKKSHRAILTTAAPDQGTITYCNY